MTDDRPLYFAVVVPVGSACYSKGHRLDPYSDFVACLDCANVAAQAAVDGIDVDGAIRAFRAWTPEPEQP